MQQIILNENLEKQNDELRKIHLYCSKINEILPEFEKETNYELNMQDVQMLIQTNNQDPLIEKVKKSMEKSFASFNQITRTILKEGIDEFVYSFAEKIKAVNLRWQIEHLKSLSIENGKLFLRKEQEQALRQTFVKAINTQSGKEFYDISLSTANGLTELLKFIKENTRINFHSVGAIVTDLFYIDAATGEVKANENIDYDYCTDPKNQKAL